MEKVANRNIRSPNRTNRPNRQTCKGSLSLVRFFKGFASLSFSLVQVKGSGLGKFTFWCLTVSCEKTNKQNKSNSRKQNRTYKNSSLLMKEKN